jgi:septum formation protein
MIDSPSWLPELILASTSPRRRELLERIGLPFRVEAVEVDETILAGTDPAQAVMELSRLKGQAVAQHHPDCLVISADTIVVLDGQILGKPLDAREAEQMLARLSGRWHRVHTGFALTLAGHPDPVEVDQEACEVCFHRLSPAQIRAYVASGEPMDKAGAYGIQNLGALLVAGIRGDYFTVMGLPVARLYRHLLDFCDRRAPRSGSGTGRKPGNR